MSWSCLAQVPGKDDFGLLPVVLNPQLSNRRSEDMSGITQLELEARLELKDPIPLNREEILETRLSVLSGVQRLNGSPGLSPSLPRLPFRCPSPAHAQNRAASIRTVQRSVVK